MYIVLIIDLIARNKGSPYFYIILDQYPAKRIYYNYIAINLRLY